MSETPEAQKEHYKKGHKELVSEVGQAKASLIIERYQKPPFDQHSVIQNSHLLATFMNPELEPDPLPPIMDRLVSVFYAPITNKTNQKALPLRRVAELIKSPVFEPHTKQLRTISEKKANTAFKVKHFANATFSGTFTTREDANLIQHSGLICMDNDNLGERLAEVRAAVQADPATVMCFVSPNGNGLKVIYEMEYQAYSQEEYYRFYTDHLSQLCGLTAKKNIDQSCKNVSRTCFLPCDPDIFINPHFTV